MPGNAPVHAAERDQLLAFLTQQREAVRNSVYGLTEEQARATPSASSLSVGGLIKHLAYVERNWLGLILQTPSGDDLYMDTFALKDNDTIATVLAGYDEVARDTNRTLTDIDLDQPVPVPKGVPWHPADLEFWTVRWVLLHLIEETARHAGHADIVRETVDGATAMPLMAAAEGWPASDWLKPWQPRDEGA